MITFNTHGHALQDCPGPTGHALQASWTAPGPTAAAAAVALEVQVPPSALGLTSVEAVALTVPKGTVIENHII